MANTVTGTTAAIAILPSVDNPPDSVASQPGVGESVALVLLAPETPRPDTTRTGFAQTLSFVGTTMVPVEVADDMNTAGMPVLGGKEAQK